MNKQQYRVYNYFAFSHQNRGDFEIFLLHGSYSGPPAIGIEEARPLVENRSGVEKKQLTFTNAHFL